MPIPAAVPRLCRFRASVVRTLFLRWQPAETDHRRQAETVAANDGKPFELETRPTDNIAHMNAPSQLSPAEKWQRGAEAFRRGELPPSDTDAGEGWYWAENALAASKPGW